MSRSGYSDGLEQWNLIRWRGAVKSALVGRRGQTLLRELADGLDAMPEKVLIANELIDASGDYCALGVVGNCRGIGEKLREIDPEDLDAVAQALDIAPALAAEIVFENDEAGRYDETPQHRWQRMRAWVAVTLKTPNAE